MPFQLLILATAICFGVRWILVSAHQYVQILKVARLVPGLPDTEVIRGDSWYESYEHFFDAAIQCILASRAKVLKIWVYFLYPVYILNHPNATRPLLDSSAGKPSGTGSQAALQRQWIGDTTWNKGSYKRRAITRHVVASTKLCDVEHNFIVKFNEVAEDLLIHLSKEGRDRSIEICQSVSMAVLDALLRCACSYDCSIQEHGMDHPYVGALNSLRKGLRQRMNNPAQYPDFVFYRTTKGRRFQALCNYVHSFIDDVIKTRRQELEKGYHGNSDMDRARPIDILDILLCSGDEHDQGLTDTEIRVELNTFIVEGHETSTWALGWALYALAKHADIQQRVHIEVRHEIGDREVDWSDLARLTYLELFIKEVLRMYTVVPMVHRQLDTSMNIDDVMIPSGSYVDVNIHAIHHNPDIWSDPQEFRPARFDGLACGEDTHSYIPFSAGPRKCPWNIFAINELKVVISRLVQTFYFELDTSHPVIQSPEMVMKAKNGIRVFLHAR